MAESAADLIQLTELAEFQTQALAAVQAGHRKLYILSETLDEAVYNTDDFCTAVRNLVIADRYCQAWILVKNIQPLLEHGHRLLELSRRLPSKVAMRKLTVPFKNNDQAYLIVDNAILLYKHVDSAYKGYVDYNARPKCKLLTEEFMQAWEQYGEVDPSLRYQLI